jgi:hypothetical protein
MGGGAKNSHGREGENALGGADVTNDVYNT